MLVEHGETRDEAEEQPELSVPAILNAEDDRDASHPEDGFERIHGEKIVEGQVNRGDQNGEGG